MPVCEHQFSSVQSLSCVWLFATPWTAAHQASLPISNSWSLLKLMFIELVMPSNHLILCHPLLLPPSIFPSIRVFPNESGLCIKWLKYWSFSFSISPSNEYSGLISFRMDWLDLLAVQRTLKSLLQHHSSKASILWCLAYSSDFIHTVTQYTYFGGTDMKLPPVILFFLRPLCLYAFADLVGRCGYCLRNLLFEMKSFLPLHLSPLHPHCEVLLPFSETLRCISQCVSFQLLPPCHFCLFFTKWLLGAPESVLVPAPWESWLCAAVAELVDSSLTSSLKITTACLMVAVGYILFFFSLNTGVLNPEY